MILDILITLLDAFIQVLASAQSEPEKAAKEK